MLYDSIENFLSDQLRIKGLNVGFTFALGESRTNQTLVASNGFEKEQFTYDTYQKFLRGKTSLECRCQPFLILKVDNLLNFLLRRLAFLILPSLMFILLLVVSLLILIVSLNRQKKLDEVKNDFINNLTHELKTPVFSISLISKVMKEAIRAGKTEKLTEHIALIEKENQQMKGHIDKVLELASLESGTYQIQPQPVDAHELLKDVIGQFLIKVESKEGQIIENLKAVSSQIQLDAHHFKNAVINLLENAIKYNDQKPQITISTESAAQQFVLQIRDNGIGIAPEDQKRIFDKFYRVSTGDLHPVKGFGLGLSYVKQIIAAHGGSIVVNSKVGEGSNFLIQLPLAGM